ncbi:MAG: PhnD/SsuA/transferrin family substrate-binding protein [Hylemonella sp.]|nr:PhnD/SsuA/transferrin family substrate-binding protein [Hylemonella sp.]
MSDLRRRAGLLAGAGWLGLSVLPRTVWAQGTAPTRPLLLGVLPITSTRVLLKNYQHVAAYLERRLGVKIELETAPDFQTFHRNTLEGRYDMIVTAPHLGRHAELDAGYAPLARYSALHRTLIVMSRARPVRKADELRGASIAMIDALTLASTEAHAWLRARGLQPGADYSVVYTPTPASAAHALVNGQALLAVSSPQGMLNTPKELRDEIEVFVALPEMPSLLWLGHGRVSKLLPQIKPALLAFAGDTSDGQPFFEATGYQGLREVQLAELQAVDVHLPRLRGMMGSGK